MRATSLALHNTFTFTHAYLPAKQQVDAGDAAWAVWQGVGEDGHSRLRGGALPKGSNIASTLKAEVVFGARPLKHCN